MPSLEFATGLKTFDINGDPEKVISFCPTDFNFIKHVIGAFESMESLQEKYKNQLSQSQSLDDIKEFIASTDKDIRNAIDAAFEAPISEMIFGKISSFAMVDGVPLWAGFLIAVLAECDAGFVSQTKAENPKLQKLLGKYKR